ncbi:MAG: transglycosylase SLT domain-containing protein [Anaerolineales bacterium]
MTRSGRWYVSGHFLILATLCVLLCGCQMADGVALTPASTRGASTPMPQGRQVETPDPARQSQEKSLSPTAMASSTFTPTPTFTAAPTPTATPTLAPEVRLEMAERALDDGDYERAIDLLEEGQKSADPSQRPGVELALGRAHFSAQNSDDAISYLTRVVTATVPTEERAEAWGLLARAYEAQGEWDAAVGAYEQYLKHDDAAKPYVQWHMARAYDALGERSQAARQFAAIDLSDFPLALQAEILEEHAQVLRHLEDYEGALEIYERILSFSRKDDYRALVSYRRGQTLRDAGREEEATKVFGYVVETYPRVYSAHLALAALDRMEAAEVTDLERGRILYYGEQYDDAVEILQRCLLSDGEGDVAMANYYLGLAYEQLGDYDAALQAWDRIIEDYTQSGWIADAWMARARVEGARGGDASKVYYEFWQGYEEHPRAPEALWRAAVALERARAWERALVFYRRVHEHHPQYEHAPEALFREGLMAYAAGIPEDAMDIWLGTLEDTMDGEQKARLLTWLGLAAQALGEEEGAREHWRRGEAAAPQSYYGWRARDLRQSFSPSLSPPESYVLPDYHLGEEAWQEIADWIAGWYEGAAQAEAEQRVETDPLMLRAAALWRLDWHSESATTLRWLRDDIRDNPQELLALARIADEMGAHAVAISCAEYLMALSREKGAGEIPGALHRLAYPTVYGHLVSAQAERHGLDPFLLLALVRQESRFNPRAVSYAGAEGLAQIMPDTGAWIASRIGHDAYQHGFAMRPVIGMRYGAWFLRFLLDLYENDWIAALVAYNAGPGNLRRWTNDAPIDDHDLFYETLPGSQAQEYVRQVYRQYRRYESIYHH